jgi:sarcosine/dimethylglycine N-methyltransferase
VKLSDSDTVEKTYRSNIDLCRLLGGNYVHYGIFESDDEDAELAKQRTVDEVADWAGLSSTSLALDIGSGFGGTAVRLFEKFGCEIHGIDPVKEQVEIATASIPSPDRHKLNFQVGKAEKIPFRDGFFDIAYSIEVFCLLKDLDKVLSESHRVLKPNGVLVLTDFVMLGNQFTEASQFYFDYAKLPRVPEKIEQYKERLSRAGFKNVEHRDLRDQVKKNFVAGKKRIEAKKEEMIAKFGIDTFNSFGQMYQNASQPAFLSEFGWGWFKAVKEAT